MPKIMPLIWAGRAVAVTLVALAFTDTIPSGSFLFWLLFALATGLVLLGGGWRKRRGFTFSPSHAIIVKND